MIIGTYAKIFTPEMTANGNTQYSIGTALQPVHCICRKKLNKHNKIRVEISISSWYPIFFSDILQID